MKKLHINLLTVGINILFCLAFVFCGILLHFASVIYQVNFAPTLFCWVFTICIFVAFGTWQTKFNH